MHAVEVLSGVVGLILGCLLGMWLAKRQQPDVDAIKAEHEAYRDDVEKHFEKTAQLAHQMAEDYRNMYHHLAQGAVELCDQNDDTTNPSLVALRRHVEKKADSATTDEADVVPGAKPIRPNSFSD